MPIRVKHFGYLVLLLLLGVNLLITGLLVFSAYSPYVQPVEHPVRSCFGLAFPIFLILNGLFLLFWLIIRQYKAALLPVPSSSCWKKVTNSGCSDGGSLFAENFVLKTRIPVPGFTRI